MDHGADQVADKVWAAMQTDVGAVRERNEDAAYVDGRGRYVVLADGMGGCEGGEVASSTAVDVVRAILDAAADELAAFEVKPSESRRRRMCALIDRAVRDANDVVVERSRVEPDHHGMGTTLEVAVVVARELFVAHVGDSRVYLVRGGAISQLTEDQTMAEAMRRANQISDDEARSSPLRSVLTNAVGCSSAVAIEHLHLRLEPGDRLLLCSDGLHDYFTPDELAAAMREGTPTSALAELVAMARGRGGHDNITGIVVEIPGTEAAPVDPLDDMPTNRVAVPLDVRRSPALAGVSDDALAAFIERALREAPGQLDADV